MDEYQEADVFNHTKEIPLVNALGICASIFSTPGRSLLPSDHALIGIDHVPYLDSPFSLSII